MYSRQLGGRFASSNGSVFDVPSSTSVGLKSKISQCCQIIMLPTRLVVIATGPEDLRQRIVSLTPQGYSQLDLTIPYWKKAQLTVAQELGQDELTSLRNTLDALTQTLSD